MGSSTGVVGISTSAKQDPAPQPGPPFTADSADNGLSVDSITGRIVLGNDEADPAAPAQLRSFRQIDTQTIAGNFGILLNAGTSLILTRLLGNLIEIIGGDFSDPEIHVIGTDGSTPTISVQSGDFAIGTIRVTGGDDSESHIISQATTGSGNNIAEVAATSGINGHSSVASTTQNTTGQATLTVGAGNTDKLTIEAGVFNTGRISFKIGIGIQTIAINTTTFCTMVQSTESAAFNGATLQVSGSHTYRKFSQSQGAGTFTLDRNTDSAKVIRNSGALTIAMPNMIGANFRDGFFFDALVNNAAGITIDATAGVTIRYGSLSTSVGGTISSTDVGAYIRVQIIDSTTYNVCFSVGLWSLT